MESNPLTEIVLPISLAVIMLGMGTSLVTADFKRVLEYPRAVAIGIFGQIILLPLLGFVLVSLFSLPPELAVGTMVLVTCAGGATSNLIVYLARGDVALSVTLTAVSSFITVISIPFVVNFSLRYFMHASGDATLPIGSTNLRLFIITLLPVLIGMFIRHNWRSFALKLERPMSYISAFFFVALVLGIVIKERAIILGAFAQAGPVTFTLNAVTMAAGFGLARLFRLDRRQSVAISVEVGVQNSATAIFIATALLQNSQIAIPPAVYSLVMYVNAGLLIGLMQWRRRREKLNEAG